MGATRYGLNSVPGRTCRILPKGKFPLEEAVTAKVEWIDETEAARILDLSEKRVRQFAAAKALRTSSEMNPETKRERTMYHAGDVEKLREDRKNRVRAASTRALATMPGMAPVRALLANGGAEISPPPPVSLRAWLRIAELAAEWDVSEGAVLELIRSGDLPARRFSCRDPWRIHRADAEALRGERQQNIAGVPKAAQTA